MATVISPSEEYARGYRDGLKDRHKSLLSFSDEVETELEWSGYSSDEEREYIAQLVQTPEYRNFFRPNLRRQALAKMREARFQMGKPELMQFCMMLGNFLNDLVAFYDEAPNTERNQPVEMGFDSAIPETEEWSQ